MAGRLLRSKRAILVDVTLLAVLLILHGPLVATGEPRDEPGNLAASFPRGATVPSAGPGDGDGDGTIAAAGEAGPPRDASEAPAAEGAGCSAGGEENAHERESCPMPGDRGAGPAIDSASAAEEAGMVPTPVEERVREDELSKAREELTALEERLLTSRAAVAELAAEVHKQESRIYELQRMIGGPTRLHPSPGAGARLGQSGAYGGAGGIGAFRVHRDSWADHLTARVAVRTKGNVTAAAIVCTEATKKTANMAKTCHYIVLGDSAGQLYFVNPADGALGAEYDTGTGSAITSLDHWPRGRNVTVVATGHANGDVAMHYVHERIGLPGGNRGIRSKNTPDPVRAPLRSEWRGSILNTTSWDALRAGQKIESSEEGLGQPPEVAFLDSFRCGRYRCLTVADSQGGFGVFYENGTMRNYDGVTMAGHRPLATRVSSTYSSVFYGHGMATLPMRASPNNPGGNGFTLIDCKGLNESTITAFQWDANNANRAYAVSEAGELLVILAQGTRQPKQAPTVNSKGSPSTDEHHAKSSCFVRSKSQSMLPLGEKLATAHIKGYLFVASSARIGVFNTTSYYRGGIQEVLVEPIQSLAEELGHVHVDHAMPVVISDGDKFVVVGFGDGMTAFYTSSLFVATPYDMSALTSMTQPIFIVAMIVVGLYQFYRARSKAVGSHGDAASKLLNDLPPHLRGKVASELQASGGLHQRGSGGSSGMYSRRSAAGGASRFSRGYGDRY